MERDLQFCMGSEFREMQDGQGHRRYLSRWRVNYGDWDVPIYNEVTTRLVKLLMSSLYLRYHK
jgi:hypothetical protein